ncbi:hypothetical protein BRADI_4g01170v3 [Brachypodium distachyon]|uniref:DUF295 domain-containing protein n=1 Tax=Brachypodium distachyon TaxID=15368 RepID=A0A0Q3EDJ0_BRADI|nr:hypothetical protein BRADI_4g01170v3 [Brachypodium distachyon]
MAKRRRCDDCGGKRAGSEPAAKLQQQRRKHLYLVLDDWDKGFSLHKLDVLGFFFSSDSDEEEEEEEVEQQQLRRLPDPPALRLTETRHSPMLFAALGSSVFIGSKEPCSAQATGALVYDTGTAAMAIGPRLPEDPCGLFVAGAGGGGEKKKKKKLYALAYVEHEGTQRVSVQALSWARSAAAALEAEPWLPSHGWSWETLPATAPFDADEESVASYAAHPDGRTIFFSTRRRRCDRSRRVGTYSLDTESGEWRSHGEGSVLPFQGQGYFERELDAWVGLHKDGYICACQAVSGTAAPAPEWRKTEHKLFRRHEDDGDPERRRHLSATLTYMGNNRFCLVESAVRDGVDLRHTYGGGHGCALHVTLFGLKYSREGELQATVRRTTTSYKVSKYIPGFYHQAFWM